MQKNEVITASSLLNSLCSPGGFFVIPSIILLSSRTVVFSLASKKKVDFLRLIMRNTSILDG